MHPNECKCAYCEMGVEEVQKMEQECMERDGFYAHLVAKDENSPTGFNAHTHGLMVSWNHPDLQLVIPMKGEVVMGLFWAAVNHIKDDGVTYQDGDVAENIAGNNYKVKFIKVQEAGRDVLRMIIPDVEGNLDVEDITGVYRHQYCDLFPCENPFSLN
jgi:hypothetical protein